jgi:hypothetical protein
VDVIPSSQFIQVEFYATTLCSRVEVRRWEFHSTVGYQISGGADAAARAIIPRQKGPLGEAVVNFATSPVDHLATTVTGSETMFSSDPEIVLAEGDEGWKPLWSAFTDTELRLGASEARVRTSPSARSSWETHPVAEADLEQRISTAEDRVTIRVGARLGPVVNRLLGIVDERIQGMLLSKWTHGPFVVNAFASAQQSVPPGARTRRRCSPESWTGVCGDRRSSSTSACGARKGPRYRPRRRGLNKRRRASPRRYRAKDCVLGVTLVPRCVVIEARTRLNDYKRISTKPNWTAARRRCARDIEGSWIALTGSGCGSAPRSGLEDWRSSGDDQTSTFDVANLIARLAFEHGESIHVADTRELRLKHVAAYLEGTRWDATQGDRIIFATRSASSNLATVPIARAADCAILCVSLGSTSLDAVRGTIEQIGRKHFLGSLLVRASTEFDSPVRALLPRRSTSRAGP